MGSTTKFISEADQRLQRLLSNGYLPNELPPPFNSKMFGHLSPEIAMEWNKIGFSKFWSRPEQYTIPRYGLARRQLSIVNPVNQLNVSYLIAGNWNDIKNKLRQSSISEFNPDITLSGNGRSITGINFEGVIRRKAEILGSYGRYVKTDIARFYPSIYTHAIAWALEGKSYAKSNHNSREFKESLGNRLDKAVGGGQQGQTVGIPIGPDTSRIIAELIAVEVEALTGNHIKDLKQRAVRYVDDFVIGLEDDQAPSSVLLGLSTALYEFELEINAEKTVSHGVGHPHSPEWINYIRTFKINSRKGRQRADLDSFFEQAFYLADAHPRENVMLFAVKRAAGFALFEENLTHLVAWLLYASRRSPGCLSFVAQQLASMHIKYPLPNEQIKAFILQQIPLKAEAGHTDEVASLLFWAREIGLKIPCETLSKTINLRSSIVALLVMELRDLDRIDGSISLTFWHTFANEEGLKSEMWLVAYEGANKQWWSKTANDTSYIENHEYFSGLWTRNISFYDRAQKARPAVAIDSAKTPEPGGGGGSSFGYPD